MIGAFYPSTAILRSEASREKNNFQKNRNPLGPRLPMFHMGGDEVNFDCWAKDESIINWLSKNGYSTKPSVSQEGFVRLWAEFQGKALDTLKEVNDGRNFTDCTTFLGAKIYNTNSVETKDNGVLLSNQVIVTGPLRWLWIKLVAKNVADTVPNEVDSLVQLCYKKNKNL